LSERRKHKVTLLTGGARSGKSTHALTLAAPYARRAFIATAEAFDDELRRRIERHREERGSGYVTVEEPLDVAGALRGLRGKADVAVVDCLTVWLGNLMHHRGADREEYAEIDEVLRMLADPPCDLVLVSNEVGMGIIPGDALTRRYRDLLGLLNRRVAAEADEVYLLVSGLPLRIKPAPDGR
jgi:adenosylcobinamide kinase/adenosylcobinamide-phosphate guanylyltransferase